MINASDMLEKCAEIISNARRVVCFTGAGMSDESGIGSFLDGLWNGFTGFLVLGWFGTPLRWKFTPRSAWRIYIGEFYNSIRDAQPNEGHRALARLQKIYPEMSIITLNLDGLHQMGGSNPDQVFELCGSVRRSRCIKKGHIYDFAGEKNLPLNSPTCRVEGCRSTLRPDCAQFMENFHSDQWESAQQATQKLEPGDVMILVGTSDLVQPVVKLPVLASERGATLIGVNLEKTDFSDLKNYKYLGGTAATTLPALVERVEQIKKAATVESV